MTAIVHANVNVASPAGDNEYYRASFHLGSRDDPEGVVRMAVESLPDRPLTQSDLTRCLSELAACRVVTLGGEFPKMYFTEIDSGEPGGAAT